MITKKCIVLLLPGGNIRQFVVSPRKTVQLVENFLAPFGQQGHGYFYKFEFDGFYDGILWGLMRIQGPGGKIQYQNLRVWSDFVHTLIPYKLHLLLGLSSMTPKIDAPDTSRDPEGLPTVFTLCRNLMPVQELIGRPDPFLEIGAIYNGANWLWKSGEFGRGKIGQQKWMDVALPSLETYADSHIALCLTIQMGNEPQIPTNENPAEFTSPEEPRY